MRHWFGKGARDLTRGEAVLLVVALPNPAVRNHAHPSRGLKALAWDERTVRFVTHRGLSWDDMDRAFERVRAAWAELTRKTEVA